jgi:hypothetical protein
VFTAQEPHSIGADKYDATAAAMMVQLKYGSGVPFARLERLEAQIGVPLPAATQWEIVEKAATMLKPAFDQLLWQGAQGQVLHNDDTGMRILRLAPEPSDKRTGIFTSGIVSVRSNRKSHYSSRAGNMRAKTWPICSNNVRNRWARPFGCAMRCRGTSRK